MTSLESSAKSDVAMGDGADRDGSKDLKSNASDSALAGAQDSVQAPKGGPSGSKSTVGQKAKKPGPRTVGRSPAASRQPWITFSPTPREPGATHLTSAANTRLTLVFVAIVALVTFFAWGGAKMSCNHRTSRPATFKVADLKKLSSSPKSAALEFHHRLFLLDFEGAKQLATETALGLVSEAKEACGAECMSQRARRQKNTRTRALLLKRKALSAVARAESHYDGKMVQATYQLGWQDDAWKIIGEGDELPPELPQSGSSSASGEAPAGTAGAASVKDPHAGHNH